MTSPSAVTDQPGAPTALDARSIAKDDAFHILQNPRRRAVLRYLLEHDDRDQFRMRNVTEEVAAWENGTTVRQLMSTARQRVYIALYQGHLPKLADHGIIKYNQNRGTIEPTPLLYVFEPYLGDGLHADVADLTGPADAPSDRTLSEAVSTFFNR